MMLKILRCYLVLLMTISINEKIYFKPKYKNLGFFYVKNKNLSIDFSAKNLVFSNRFYFSVYIYF